MAISITVDPGFGRALKRLPPDRGEAAIEALVKFVDTPMLPRLNFRPLQGKKGYFIINARHGDRLVLRKIGENAYVATDVGPHDNVYRKWNRLK